MDDSENGGDYFIKELKKIFEECVYKTLKDDNYLVKNDTHESSIAFRIGHYLQNELNDPKNLGRLNIPKDLVVDLEYNRDSVNIKKCENGIVRPDLIVHVRGKSGILHNFMVIEIKKNGSSDREIERDYNKLRKFTSSKGKFQYQIGGHLVINLPKINICWFKDGEECPRILPVR